MKTLRIISCTGFLIALVVIQYLIWHNEDLTAQQKLFSSLFAWIIPCTWLIILLSIGKTTKTDQAPVERCLFYRFGFALN